MKKLFQTAIVEKRNFLNSLKTSFHSTAELRLFSIYLSKINPHNEKTRIVRFPLSDYQNLMGFGRLNIKQLKSSAENILKAQVFLPKENGGFKGINLFETFEVDQDESGGWYVEINATNSALPLLFNFKDRYFKYELFNALQLKSSNQIRIYELLKQFEGLGKREIAVDELQELLGVSYTRWDRFKSSVLDNCQKALEQNTDICYTYEKGKSGVGGKWLTIIFHIRKNKSHKEPISILEFMKECDETESIIVIDEQLQEAKKAEFCDIQQNDDTDFFVGACDGEFSVNQIESFIAVINTMTLPLHPNGTAFAKYHYLLEIYTRFKAIAEHTPISNRYSYFYKMICSERDDQNGDYQ